MKQTKLFFTMIGFFFGIAVAISGIAIIFVTDKGSGPAVLGQGLGLVTLVLGIYTTGNVSQNKQVSENYRPELDREK